MASSRKVAVASLPSILLIGALLLLMVSPGAVSEEGAASGQQFPSTLDRTPEPSPKTSRAVRAGSSVVSSLVGALPAAPASAPMDSDAIPPQAPAPQPHPRPKDSDDNFCFILLIIIILCCMLQS